MAKAITRVVVVFEIVLDLELDMGGEAIAQRGIDPPRVVAPRLFATETIGNIAVELLVPAHGAEELRREFVFCLNEIPEHIRIPDPRHFEPRLMHFRPDLEMMPLEADVLRDQGFAVIVEAAAGRQSGGRVFAEI